MLRINELKQLDLGVQGDNEAQAIVIDVNDWLADHQNGSVTIWHKRNGENIPSPTGAEFDPEAGTVTWIPTDTDTYYEGEGLAEIRLVESNVIKKTRPVKTNVGHAVTGVPTPHSSGWQSYINAVDTIRQATVVAKDEAEAAQGLAETAQAAAETAQENAEDAKTAAETARDAAQAAAGDFQGISASAEGLDEGEDPTIEVTHSEGGLYHFDFGIPKGDKGDQGDPAPMETVQTAVNTYLATVITNPDSPPLDRNLLSDEAAAPADMVGDLKSALDVLQYDAHVAPKGIQSDAQDVDLDVTDPSGNVLLRLQDGHIKTKEFDSSEIQEELDGKQDALTFDNVPTSNSDNPVKSEGIYNALQSIENEIDVLESRIEITPKQSITDAQNTDLDVTDPSGNVLLRLQDGHIKTKEFDSSEIQEELDGKQDALTFDNVPTSSSDNPVKSEGIYNALQSIENEIDALESRIEITPKQSTTDAQNTDLDVTDPNGHVLVRLKNGHIETKGFNSAYKLAELRTSTEDNTDFDLSDDSGNIILRLKNGELQTKKLDLTNPYYLPDYYTDYLDAKCARIRTLLSESGGDAFIFITDQHFTTGNANHSFQLIYHIAKRCRINKLFCGGDMWDGVNELYANQFRDAIKDANGGRCYFVIGNHEMFSTTDNEVQYALTALTDDEITDAEHIPRHYYYVDNPKNKVRYVILNGYSEGDTVPTREDGYEPDQMAWLHNVAMNVETGWQIVIITHELYRVTNLYDSTLKVTNAIQTIMNDIDSYNTGGEIVLMVQGHTHLDAIKQTTGGIPIMITCCDKYYPAGGEGGELWLNGRVPGTVTEQCFDVCVLDTVNRKLTAVRIGGFATDDPEQDEQLYEVGERVINY